MNKRIKELAAQAGFKTFAGSDIFAAEPEHPDDEGRVDIELNKFAQLIIQECARIAGDNFNSGFVDEIIKEYFGLSDDRA